METKNEVYVRLLEFIKYLHISIRAFERNIGVCNGYVKGVTKGISAERLLHISGIYPELNTNWLLTGEGSMLNNEDTLAADVTKSYTSPRDFDIQLRAAYLRGKRDGFDEALALLNAPATAIKKPAV